MKPQNNQNRNGKKTNLFSKWVGEANQSYTGKEMGEAFLACLGLIALSLVLTSFTRLYNYDHFIHSQGEFLPDNLGYQFTMFLMYGVFSIAAVICSYITSHKNGKKLMLGATIAAMGLSSVMVLVLFFGLDFLTITFYVHQAGLGFEAFGRMLNSYFVQYGILYLIPVVLAFISFGTQAYYKSRQDETSGDYGTAKLADKHDLKAMGAYDNKGVLFGKEKGKLLRYDNCHRTIVAYSGGGKTTSIAVPALLDQKGCFFVNDYKGELWAITARHRCESFAHEIAVFDPYAITKQPQFLKNKPPYLINKDYRFNPLDLLPENPDERDSAIGRLVESMMMRGVTGKSDHFDEMAMTLLRGIIEWVVTTEAKPSLLHVHDALAKGKDATQAFLEAMLTSNSPRVTGAAARVSGTAKEEHGGIFSTAYRQISWVADPSLRRMVSETTVDLKDLLLGKMDIYVVLQDPESSEQSRAFRVLLNCIRTLMLKTPMTERPEEEVTFLLDEFGQMGYCKDIESMVPIMRSYKAVFWFIFQTLSQIEKYESSDYFTGAPMLQFFNIGDLKTMEWIEKLGGTFTTIKKSSSENKGGKNSSHSESISASEAEAKLFHTNEIREMSGDNQIVFIKSRRPIYCQKIPYFAEKIFQGKYDFNPVENK